MELAARQFARRVLLAQFALLLLVLLAVGMAAKYLYAGARQEVIQQSEGTQGLLARQTALGVENYYSSVTSVLNLLQPPENATTQPAPRLPVGGKLPANLRENRRRLIEGGPFLNLFNHWGPIIWSNVNQKVSTLFVVDVVDDMSVIKVLGTTDGAPDPADVAKQARDWLATVKTESISPYMPDIAGGAHLVSVPVRSQGGVQMVAVVPVSNVEKQLLQFVNRSSSQRAGLIDDRGTFVSAARNEFRGKNAGEFSDKRIAEICMNAAKTGAGTTQTFDKFETLGGVQVKPSMISVEPVNIPGGHRWLVIVASDLADVDNLVQPIFHDALSWTIVLMIAVMAILTSTAVQMIGSRLRLERAQMEMINKEMEQARQIQLNWLPDQPCSLKGVDICAVNTPASHISGDFYNWFELPDGRIAIIIGDVTGHGMSAAFLMATTQLLVRTNLPRVCDPGYCLEEVNRQLCTQVFNGQFVTMQILIIDLENKQLDIASAGHPPPFLSDNGSTDTLPVDPQLVLGVDETTEYPTQHFPLNVGAGLLLYTDGVPDAVAPSGERFTEAGLRATLRGHFKSAQQMLQTVTRKIESFRTGRDLSDDLTLVAVHLQAAVARLEEAVVAK